MNGSVLFWLLVVVAVVVAVVAYRLEQKRRDRIMAFALNRAWLYVAEDPSLVDSWPGEPFGRGDNRRARTVLTGMESGRQFVAFDYTYDTHTNTSKGRRTTTHRFAVCVVPLPAPLGVVELLPEDLLTRAAGAMGIGGDIDLESEDFNRRYRVRARNPKLASDILTPRTMEYLVGLPDDAVTALRVQGMHAIAWHPGRLDPAQVIRTCAVVDRVIDGVPSFVWRDAGIPDGYDPAP